jgi:hypothetical protein
LGGDHREKACSTGPARRREASCGDVRPDTVQRTHPARPRPKTKHVWGSSTDRRTRSPLRKPLTAHPVKLPEDVAISVPFTLQVTCQLTPHSESWTAVTTRRPPLLPQSLARS